MLFDTVKSTRYDPPVGFYAGWAIWANAPEDDLLLLNDPRVLKELRNDVVMVALNPSARIPVPLRNFHGEWGGSG